MNIFINGRFLSQPVSGVQRYALEVIKALDRLIDRGECEDLTFTLVCPRHLECHNLSLKHIQIMHCGRYRGNLWEQLELPFFTKGSLLVNLCNTYPLAKTKQLTTIHDTTVFTVPEAYSRLFRIWYKFLLKASKYRNRALCTVSRFSKEEMKRAGAIPERNIHVLYEGHQHMQNVEPADQILEKHRLKPSGYILAVSSLNPNKNFGNLVKAIGYLSDLNMKVAIVGGVNPRVFSGINTAFHESDVQYVGYVSDSELKSLYQNAYCFVFPSFNEGFGLPPLEAMSLGCPVIVSNRASLPEIFGDAALYCEPGDPHDIADRINSLISNPQLREEMKNRGLEHSKLFSWESCARQFIDVIRGTNF